MGGNKGGNMASESGNRRVLCADCKTELLGWSQDEVPAERTPCPHCGSLSRLVDVYVTDTVEVHSMLGVKAKTPGERRPFSEQKVGDEFFRKTGRWHRVRRLVDRRGNRYVEHIEDAETGEVIRDVEEPLTDHQGRGDAARR